MVNIMPQVCKRIKDFDLDSRHVNDSAVLSSGQFGGCGPFCYITPSLSPHEPLCSIVAGITSCMVGGQLQTTSRHATLVRASRRAQVAQRSAKELSEVSHTARVTQCPLSFLSPSPLFVGLGKGRGDARGGVQSWDRGAVSQHGRKRAELIAVQLLC